MSTIQNLKNFIRHGKQARDGRSPHDQATTHVSNVHAQQHRGVAQHNGGPADYGVSEPNLQDHRSPHAAALPQQPQEAYSTAPGDNRNQAAKAGHAAANAAEAQQKRDQKAKDYDPSVLERIVAEERESKGKLPRYPGLERWTLVEKMGDGAFSNVYRARDNNHQYPEVAIKVVRKFEMNSTQVRNDQRRVATSPTDLPPPSPSPPCPPHHSTSRHLPTILAPFRAKGSCTRTMKAKRPRPWRCDSCPSFPHLPPLLFSSPPPRPCAGTCERLTDVIYSQRANILKEVQIMRQLDHPNIVGLVDFSESRQYYYIILELCPGGELFHQIVRLTYFSEDLARHVITQVANALEYLHEEAGVVHR